MRNVLRRGVRVAAIVLGALVLVLAAFALYVQVAWDRPVDRPPVVAMRVARDAARVRRGQYLYERSLLCWDCHGSKGSRSPAEPQAGGREFDMSRIGPGFGYVYGSNVTPDVETGIGAWSNGELVRAIREGVGRDGRLIFPVMAYQFYHGLSDDDATSIVAYLRSLPPIRNRVPARRLSFPAKALFAVSFIKPERPITSPIVAPRAAPTPDYGEYLAWHASGCAECHTPRDPKTAEVDPTRPLAGGLFPFPEPGFTTTGSNLTPDAPTGLGGWTEEQFVTAVQTGVRPNGTVMLPFMPWPAYASWSRDDLHAVWLYVRSLRPVFHRVPASTLGEAAARGRGPARGGAIYDVYCLICHGEKGGGSPFTNVPLRDAVRGLDAAAVGGFIADGLPGTAMPPFGKTLSREQIADLAGFIRTW